MKTGETHWKDGDEGDSDTQKCVST
jgi:hypothetical protein